MITVIGGTILIFIQREVEEMSTCNFFSNFIIEHSIQGVLCLAYIVFAYALYKMNKKTEDAYNDKEKEMNATLEQCNKIIAEKEIINKIAYAASPLRSYKDCGIFKILKRYASENAFNKYEKLDNKMQEMPLCKIGKTPENFCPSIFADILEDFNIPDKIQTEKIETNKDNDDFWEFQELYNEAVRGINELYGKNLKEIKG